MAETKELTPEERAVEIIELVLTGFPEFRQSIVENALVEAEERGRLEEREACALAVWDADPPTTNGTFNLLDVRATMAKAIRARSSAKDQETG